MLRRPEISRTGVYFLLGDDESFGGTLVYMGEDDDVSTRLRQHARTEEHGGKDFLDRAIVLTSRDANLTKAHDRYLESRPPGVNVRGDCEAYRRTYPGDLKRSAPETRSVALLGVPALLDCCDRWRRAAG